MTNNVCCLCRRKIWFFQKGIKISNRSFHKKCNPEDRVKIILEILAKSLEKEEQEE
jgi:hypothetical protein